MLASTFSFLGGWVLLAHSLKPSQTSSPTSAFSGSSPAIALTPLPTLAPLPGMNIQQTQSFQAIQNPFTIVAQPQVQQNMPVFTTSGS